MHKILTYLFTLLILSSNSLWASSSRVGGLVAENIGDLNPVRSTFSAPQLMEEKDAAEFDKLITGLSEEQLYKLDKMYGDLNDVTLAAIQNAEQSKQKRNGCRAKFHDRFSGVSKAIGLAVGALGAMSQLASAMPVPCEVAGYLTITSLACYAVGGSFYWLGTQSGDALERIEQEQYGDMGKNQQRQGLIKRLIAERRHRQRESNNLAIAGEAQMRLRHRPLQPLLDEEPLEHENREAINTAVLGELGRLSRQIADLQQDLKRQEIDVVVDGSNNAATEPVSPLVQDELRKSKEKQESAGGD